MTNKMRVFNGQIAQNDLSTADPRVSQNPHVGSFPPGGGSRPKGHDMSLLRHKVVIEPHVFQLLGASCRNKTSFFF